MMQAGVTGRRREVWRTLAWRHPEWWSVALAVAAWLLLVSGVGLRESHSSTHHHEHASSLPVARSETGDAGFGWLTQTYGWLVMVVAMMVPLVLGSIVTTAARSLWHRRSRAVGGFLAGYVVLWLITGATLLGIVALSGLDRWIRLPEAAVAGFAVAASWQLTSFKRRALRACHRTAPLAPRGWRADRDCLRYGWAIGLRCLLSCWALMLACMLAGHGLTAMLAVSVIGITERYRNRPDPRVGCAVMSGLAIAYAVGAVR